MSARKNKQTYSKQDQISHVLHRPDMYIGSTEPSYFEEFIVNDELKIEKKKIFYSPGLLRIFIEPLSNIIDNVTRSKKDKNPVTKICISIEKDTGKTTFWNDGSTIPIEIHDEEKCYIHTMIFGHMLTSSNYNDEEERIDISGRNGVGVKASNVFSTKFIVKGVDSENNLSFEQTWTNNMKKVDDPIIKKCKLKKGYTEIEYYPDFKQFKMKEYTDDIIGLYKKYVIDTAMLTGVNVYFNNELIPVKSLKDYAKLYEDKHIDENIDENKEENNEEILVIKTDNADVLVTPAKTWQCISFASGVCTPLGGVHVDAWCETLFRPIVDRFNKPKSPHINIKDVKNCFRLFVIARVVNPKFESQSKCKLVAPNINAPYKKVYTTKMWKWSAIARIRDEILRAKDLLALKKSERKQRTYTKIDKLDRANYEGHSKYGRDCTLIIVEGDSAKSYATSGIEYGAFGLQGRDWFGIYKLKGKILNTRNCKGSVIAKNEVVTDIIKALNLRNGIDYTDDNNFKTLRYGRIMILTDADVDGIHISALCQNMIHNLFPSLLQREEPFITSMQTPIATVTLGKKMKLFYDERQYKIYINKFREKYPKKKLICKYYKGLGTSNDEMVEKTFGVKILKLFADNKTSDAMTKVFHTKYSNQRKEWLAKYDPEDIRLIWKTDNPETQSLSITDFIDTELIKFSLADCKRSIPSIMDGLKESQRKILYGAFLKNLKYSGREIKVAQFGGFVSEKTGYHHGEQNLYDTITKMADAYVGSNNIPLFRRDGRFGTRVTGGKDAAAARYIFTRLDMLTRTIFNQEDDELLERNEDDGDIVEPVYYVPIIPMILVNGSTAIGTGWSTSIPCYNPLDLVECIKVWLHNDGKVIEYIDDMILSVLPSIKPWYHGFKGEISAVDGKYITHGCIERKTNKKIRVTELPIGMWTDKFKDKLESWKEEKQIKDYVNYSNNNKVDFIITESMDGIICNEKNMNLTTNINLTNMVAFTEEGAIKKFGTVEEIIDHYCKIRYEYYILRKKNSLKRMEDEISLLGNKKRFLEEVLEGKINLFIMKNKQKVAIPTKDLVKVLEERKYDKLFKNKDKEDNEEDDKESGKHGYEYLLSMQIRSITAEKINKLRNDLESCIKRKNELENTSEKQIWINELDNFVKEYEKFDKILTNEKEKKARKKKEK